MLMTATAGTFLDPSSVNWTPLRWTIAIKPITFSALVALDERGKSAKVLGPGISIMGTCGTRAESRLLVKFVL